MERVVIVFAMCLWSCFSPKFDEGILCDGQACPPGYTCVEGACRLAGGTDGGVDAPIVDAPIVDAPIVDAPIVDAPIVDAPIVDAGPCDPVANTGCGDGEKCGFILAVVETRTGYVGCVADGTRAIGQECEQATEAETSDDCVGGGYCYNGTCRQICTTTGGECGDGSCADNFVDGNGQLFPIAWCLLACDPLAQDCPSANEACLLSDNEAGGICIRTADPPAEIGEQCQFANSCVRGAICTSGGGLGVCRRLCGTILQMWEVVDDELRAPLCCGPDCDDAPYDATVSCNQADELCALIPGSEPGTVRIDVGVCTTDAEVSNEGMFDCDCSTSPNPDGVCTLTQ
jgi:hypothetical protein